MRELVWICTGHIMDHGSRPLRKAIGPVSFLPAPFRGAIPDLAVFKYQRPHNMQLLLYFDLLFHSIVTYHVLALSIVLAQSALYFCMG
jgi:hypothetical protein